MSNYILIENMYCPSCGSKTIYEDTQEKPDFYEGKGSYCKTCGVGGYYNICLLMTEQQLDELKNTT